MTPPLLLILALCGPIDRERFLHALAQVESNDNPKAVGKAGEVGRHQISKIAFRELSRLGVSSTGDPARQLLDIKLSLIRKAGRAETPEMAALVWHWGFTGAKRRKWRVDDHSRRVQNIYERVAKGVELQPPLKKSQVCPGSQVQSLPRSPSPHRPLGEIVTRTQRTSGR